MGNGGLNSAVADAGPLIHLAEIGCIPLLQVFDALHVPDSVWAEVLGNAPSSEEAALDLESIQRHEILSNDLDSFARDNDLQELHAGERECLYLCRRLEVSTFLTDDLAAREAGQRLGLNPVGSLGIIVRAYRLGHIALEDAERHIGNLFDVSSLYVTRAVVELAIAQLRLQGRQG